MAKGIITKEGIEALSPEGEIAAELWDPELAGLHAKKTVAGNVSFLLAWREGETQRKKKIGSYPAMSADEARELAAKCIAARWKEKSSQDECATGARKARRMPFPHEFRNGVPSSVKGDIWWVANRFRQVPEHLIVYREVDRSVYCLAGCGVSCVAKKLKVSHDEMVVKTYAEARAIIIGWKTEKESAARESLKQAKKELAAANAMPEQPPIK